MIRLDKFLSEMSGWTRSEVKKIVRTGSVTVDGNEVKKPETKIDEKLSIVSVDGRQIKYNKYEYYMLNKPKGFVSATTDREHKTVVDIISSSEKKDLFPVGRLDIDTEGLLLITNDGELAHRLLAPKNHVEKTYYVEVSGILDDVDVDAVEKGLDIGEEKNTIPAKIFLYARRFLLLTIRKVTPPNRTTGKRYAHNPIIPKQILLIAFPTIPPIPNALIIRIRQAANITRIRISV